MGLPTPLKKDTLYLMTFQADSVVMQDFLVQITAHARKHVQKRVLKHAIRVFQHAPTRVFQHAQCHATVHAILHAALVARAKGIIPVTIRVGCHVREIHVIHVIPNVRHHPDILFFIFLFSVFLRNLERLTNNLYPRTLLKDVTC
jgi:hypothetical protein